MTIRVTGLDVLDTIYSELTEGRQRSLGLSALRKVSKPVIKEAKNILKSHRRTGNLSKSLGLATAGRREVALYFGARKKGNFKGWHGALVNNGTQGRTTKKGANRGRTKGLHYIERSMEKTSDVQQIEFENAMSGAIGNMVKRAAKRSKWRDLK